MADRLFVATRKGLFFIDRGSNGWSVASAALLGDPVTMLLQDRSGDLHAAQDMGHFGVKLKRTRDGGQSWSDRAVPMYPPQPEDHEELDPIRKQPVDWSLKTIWSMECGHDSRSQDLWCGTIPGGLFRSTNNGDSWQIVDGLWNHPQRQSWSGGGADFPGIHSIFVDPRKPESVRIGVSVSGLWASDDDGKNWDCRGKGMRAEYMPPEQAYEPSAQDPHCIVQCRADPDRLWIQHHNGIFRSDDGGQTCSEVVCDKPSSFGFATVCDPNDPDTAWFVPGVKDEKRYPVDGKLVVTRTSDAGRSFSVLSNGLPQEHSYDLIYRHALAIDQQGECLAFGSTTGNFFISENRGDSWQLVSSTLPPVYCVRFAN